MSIHDSGRCGVNLTTEMVRQGIAWLLVEDLDMTYDEGEAAADRWLSDELHAAYGRGFDEGFSAGYADRSAELAEQPFGPEG